MKKLEDYVRCIPDFPSKGIMFRDITSVIQDPDGLKLAIDSMIEAVRDIDFDDISLFHKSDRSANCCLR